MKSRKDFNKTFLIFNDLENYMLKGGISRQQFNDIWGIITFRLGTKSFKNPYNVLSFDEQRSIQFNQKIEFSVINLCEYFEVGINDNLLKSEHYREILKSVKPYIPLTENQKILLNNLLDKLNQQLTAELLFCDIVNQVNNCQDENELELLAQTMNNNL